MLHVAIFHRYPVDEPPLFCGPDAMQPRGAVALPDGSAISDAWFADLPNLAAMQALIASTPHPIIIHPGYGRGGLYNRRVVVMEIVNEEAK
jgi:hypothetical protein